MECTVECAPRSVNIGGRITEAVAESNFLLVRKCLNFFFF